ncbi:lipopolysaccharide-induced tumor necrosis factor-alpha factor homolog [Melanaphis sacchari]|uniref:Lipopolysaccharide-induced tumor necrosis factor-alpha factor n=1 Tax=Melanaphis sacchari TaxID=742174 RepID=A0A2H8TSG5_9HEMI|nr:lipopolysaccharide-induced tumor necrosis factor-alpha factor homolog [Melanaphis sacchari]XP_025193825.1 lipopolysaccharide-induced tumor necrosis factor-alpha factor homolog [Melanaphis sacchari]XP_025193826.1 lipopolysaccharide-induced tumor necrosis factor-alpha factor homolog [Melanaphis sacchari]XP_025193827.1 lipopolysaccharide-induced tumor necrosis factor-alpha factor homolog [Melanaphis sacchari]XP_025193828.1 lipopolysaccharide-induced tumor necrosis factor-alpha factor homolog [M
MYPQVNKDHLPSAPPTYSDSMNAPKYEATQMYNTPGMLPPQPSQVIVVQGPLLNLPPLGPRSVQLTCPTCKSLVMTRIEEESSSSAYLCCMLMFIVGCFVCSCLPLCMDNFKNYKHSCPNCNAFLGLYKS